MSDSNLRLQYQVLAGLKKIDEKIFQVRRQLDRIPKEIEKLSLDLTQKRNAFEAERSTLVAHEKKQRELESELKDFEEKIRKAEGKLMEVKTNEEYKAAQKEIDAQKLEKGTREDRVLSLLAESEGERQKVKQAEGVFKEAESVAKKDCEELETDRKRIEAQLKQHEEGRAAAVSQLSKDAAELYRRVCARVQDVAVVCMENSMCLGCNMMVRPQLYNEVLGFKALHQCPNCARILITEEPLSEPTEVSA